MSQDWFIYIVLPHNRSVGGIRTEPTIDVDMSGLSDTSITHSNGITTLRFTRARNTGDPQDEDLSSETDCHYIIVAWGGSVVYGIPSVIGLHSSTDRAVTTHEICFPNNCAPGM